MPVPFTVLLETKVIRDVLITFLSESGVAQVKCGNRQHRSQITSGEPANTIFYISSD